ncbi:putative cytochrome P450 [Helianthus annuus]|nr:putative cytochrome P450 [Helianthus annuus]
MFCLLVFMCFGEKFDESKVNVVAKVHLDLLLHFRRFRVLTSFPKLGKILFRNRWKKLEKLRSDRDKVVIRLIKSRIRSGNSEPQLGSDQIVAYVDTLVNLRFPKEDSHHGNGERLTLNEMATICMKHPRIQSKLYDEIVEVVGPPPLPLKGVEPEMVINEDDLQKMPYLKAVVLEGLRRHPPAHFVLPHRVMKEVEVQGYMIPQGATINFMVGAMGLDPKVWDEPMEFKPERFLNDGVFDVSGSKGIKMMPFGAGRRICPGSDLALLHLKYFVANLI